MEVAVVPPNVSPVGPRRVGWSRIEAKGFNVFRDSSGGGCTISEAGKTGMRRLILNGEEAKWVWESMQTLVSGGGQPGWKKSGGNRRRSSSIQCLENKGGKFLVISTFDGGVRGSSISVLADRECRGWLKFLDMLRIFALPAAPVRQGVPSSPLLAWVSSPEAISSRVESGLRKSFDDEGRWVLLKGLPQEYWSIDVLEMVKKEIPRVMGVSLFVAEGLCLMLKLFPDGEVEGSKTLFWGSRRWLVKWGGSPLGEGRNSRMDGGGGREEESVEYAARLDSPPILNVPPTPSRARVNSQVFVDNADLPAGIHMANRERPCASVRSTLGPQLLQQTSVIFAGNESTVDLNETQLPHGNELRESSKAAIKPMEEQIGELKDVEESVIGEVPKIEENAQEATQNVANFISIVDLNEILVRAEPNKKMSVPLISKKERGVGTKSNRRRRRAELLLQAEEIH